MSDETKNKHSKIRTFAMDLEEQRENRKSEVLPENKEKVESPTPRKEIPKKMTPLPPKPAPKPKPRPIPHIVEKPEETKPKPKPEVKKIPSFHELQKQAESVQKNTLKKDIPPPPKPLPKKDKKSKTKTKQPTRTNIGFDSTIITDNKDERFKLFPSIVSSIKSWIKKFKTSRKKKSTPKYSVPETTRRKGVIQKATSKTGTIFAADSDTLKEQIRRRRMEEGKDSDEDEEVEYETSWSPYTEAGYNLLEGPDTTENVVVEYKKPVIIEPTRKERPVEIIEEEGQEAEEIEGEEIEEEVPVESPVTETPDEEKWEEPPVTPEEEIDIPVVESVETTEDQELKINIEESEPRPRKMLSTDTNTLTVTIVVMVVGFVAILLAGRLIVQQLNSESPTITAVPIENLLDNSSLEKITLTTDTPDELPKLITATIENGPVGVVELPVISTAGDEVLPSYVFELLQLQTQPSLQQSITIARFVSINKSEPAIVFNFVDVDTVRGGLLKWEEFMASDLQVLYNLPSDIEAPFIDDTISDTDVRLLIHEGETVLVYGIINETVIITPETQTFAQIKELGLSD